jgi:hypothetical protein
MLSAVTFPSMIGSRVSVLVFGTMAVKTFPTRLSKPNTATFPDIPLPRFPLRVPPK